MDTQITPTVSVLDDDDTTFFDALAVPDEAALEAMRRSHCTLIQTINSFYLFLMTDPDERRGLLVGGAVGESPTSATLLGGVRITDSRDYAADENAGMRVVFLVEAAGRSRRVVTSRVVHLAHTAVHGRGRRTVTH
jgi:hypothetical protein